MKQWYFLLFILWRLSVAKSYIRLYNIEKLYKIIYNYIS